MGNLTHTRRQVASREITRIEEENGKLTNMLIAIVRGNGGTIRISKDEFLKIEGCVLKSVSEQNDAGEYVAQVLSVRRVARPQVVT